MSVRQIHTTKYYPAVKRKGLLISALTQTEPKGVIWSKKKIANLKGFRLYDSIYGTFLKNKTTEMENGSSWQSWRGKCDCGDQPVLHLGCEGSYTVIYTGQDCKELCTHAHTYTYTCTGPHEKW